MLKTAASSVVHSFRAQVCSVNPLPKCYHAGSRLAVLAEQVNLAGHEAVNLPHAAPGLRQIDELLLCRLQRADYGQNVGLRPGHCQQSGPGLHEGWVCCEL